MGFHGCGTEIEIILNLGEDSGDTYKNKGGHGEDKMAKPFAGGAFSGEQKRMHGGNGMPGEAECDDKMMRPDGDYSDIDKPELDDGWDGDNDADDMDGNYRLLNQLLQTISMMDTETDAVNDGTMDANAAVKAIDNMTSRVLWGKQEDSNPQSSYQNANYGSKVGAGLVMNNPAEQFNSKAYGKEDTNGKQIQTGDSEKETKPGNDSGFNGSQSEAGRTANAAGTKPGDDDEETSKRQASSPARSRKPGRPF